jgi:hypothetical protein
MAGPGHDDMINQLNAEDGSGLLQLGSDGNILAAGLQGTRRVIVYADDRRRPVCNGIGKDLAGVHETVVEQPDGYDPVPEHLPGAVQGNADKMLLSFVTQVCNQREDVFRPGHFSPPILIPEIPPAQLKAGHDLGSLRGPDPLY